MLDFFRRLFAPEPRSSETAKERLRLVLLSDHLSLAPDVVEALKADLLTVISRYLEIDPSLADVTFEQREREVAMLASIPIMGVRERSGAVAPAAAAPQAEPLAAEPAAQPAQPEIAVAAAPLGTTVEASAVDEAAAGAVRATSGNSRRRRRKKAAAAAANRAPSSAAAPGLRPA